MRIAEIIGDYRNIQTYIAAIRASPSTEEYNEEGYIVLRRCVAAAQALLAQPFQTASNNRGDDEQDKLHLRRIIADASIRRFRAQKLYLQATAALRWINARNAVLQGHRPHSGQTPALQQIRATLRAELGSITDARVELSLRSADDSAGKWLGEDPSLQQILRVVGGAQGSGR
ncbi:hypothetical protein LTR62_006755 [Meristemomyces frigidus]|uniref:Uncharacterized protein n=1 Tax=Meristemomyces frigidus TaxID=1508187 RepID=A0AAN7YMP1_9PEZI|nr:hypothetical protein LTR62_006755 [Meristemomyces frigidus]